MCMIMGVISILYTALTFNCFWFNCLKSFVMGNSVAVRKKNNLRLVAKIVICYARLMPFMVMRDTSILKLGTALHS